MAVTKCFENVDCVDRFRFDLPIMWKQMIDTVSTSSNVAYNQISLVDEEVEKRFEKKTESIERKIGDKNLYSQKEFEELNNRKDEIQLPK